MNITELRHRFIRSRADAQQRHTEEIDAILCALLNALQEQETGTDPEPDPPTDQPSDHTRNGAEPTPSVPTPPVQPPEPEPVEVPTQAPSAPPVPPEGRERDDLLLSLGEHILEHTAEACSEVVGDDVTATKGRRTTTLVKWLEELDAHDWTEKPAEEQDGRAGACNDPGHASIPGPTPTIADLLGDIDAAEDAFRPEEIGPMRAEKGLPEDGPLDEDSAGPMRLGGYLELLQSRIPKADMPF